MPAGSTYSTIATTTFGSAATSYTFTSIPSTYTDLVLVGNLSSSSNTNISIRINSDSGTNYSNTYLTGVNGTGASSARGVNSTAGAATWTGASMNSSVSTLLVNFMNYSNTTTYKTFIARYGAINTVNQGETTTVVNLWRNTAAISSIEITAISTTYGIGSQLTLYGIASA